MICSPCLSCDTIAVLRLHAGVSGGQGVAGVRTPLLKIAGVDPRRNMDISVSFFLETYKILTISDPFKISWPKSEEKMNFGGRWVWMPTAYESDPPIKMSWRRRC